jgi:hypothetical protein
MAFARRLQSLQSAPLHLRGSSRGAQSFHALLPVIAPTPASCRVFSTASPPPPPPPPPPPSKGSALLPYYFLGAAAVAALIIISSALSDDAIPDSHPLRAQAVALFEAAGVSPSLMRTREADAAATLPRDAFHAEIEA